MGLLGVFFFDPKLKSIFGIRSWSNVLLLYGGNMGHNDLWWVVRPTGAQWTLRFGVPLPGDIICASMKEAERELARCTRWPCRLLKIIAGNL